MTIFTIIYIYFRTRIRNLDLLIQIHNSIGLNLCLKIGYLKVLYNKN
jgi:hypothetical protein